MNEFNFMSLLKTILNKLWLILLIAVVAASVTFTYLTFFVTPTYRSTGSFITSNGGISNTPTNNTSSGTSFYKSSDLSSSLQLKATYIRILQTDSLYKRIAEKIGNGYTYKTLKNSITITNSNEDDLFIDIAVVDTNKQNASKIANCFLEEGSLFIKEFLPDSYVKPMDSASNAVKNYPTPIRDSVLVFLASAVIVVLILALIQNFDDTIKDEEDFRSRYKYPILGIVPDFSAAAKEE